MRSYSRLRVAVCLLVAVVTGCDLRTGPGPVAEVEIIGATSTLMVGDTLRLTAVLRDASGRELRRTVTWSSGDEAVAVVTSDGVLTATGSGSATVTAAVENRSGSVALSVTVRPLVSAGFDYTCRIAPTGALDCWGANRSGQLGNGAISDSGTPAPVSGGRRFVSVGAGVRSTCGVAPGGATYCWGANDVGQLGTGSTTPAATPVLVAGGLPFRAVTAGPSHACGLTRDGRAYCWGVDRYGELGRGAASETCLNPVANIATPCSTRPVPVSGGLTFASLSAGAWHTCGVTTSGAAYCWGSNLLGQLGSGAATENCEPQSCRSTVPVPVAGGLTFTTLSAGTNHTCAVAANGAAHCWGYNLRGELGNGSTTPSAVPVPVSGGLTFRQVSAGVEHACGITPGGAAHCWGRNSAGELGNGTSQFDSATPGPVSGGLVFAMMSGGSRHTCGVTTSGTTYCWGYNLSGQLGSASTEMCRPFRKGMLPCSTVPLPVSDPR